MFYQLEMDMSGDVILTAARDLLAQQPSVEALDAEVAAQLHMAEATQIQLRADIRALIAEYRVWRRDIRCGRAADGAQPVNLKMLKQIRAGFATYRLSQILLRDIRSIAMLDSARPIYMKKFSHMPVIAPVGDTPTPANQDAPQAPATPASPAADSIDQMLYDELEAKYGPSLAQKLYDEVKQQEEADKKSAKPN